MVKAIFEGVLQSTHGPEQSLRERRSKAFGLDLMADCSRGVVLR